MGKGPILFKKRIYYSSFFVGGLKFLIPLILSYLKVKIISAKGEIPLNGPLLIAVHHEEIVDQYIILIKTKRRLFWVVDILPPESTKSLADTIFLKWLLQKLGGIPIDKRNPWRNIDLFDYSTYLLKKGEVIVIFPEGYLRSERNNERLGEAKDGIIRIAQFAQKKINKRIPIYPIGLEYKKRGDLKEAYMRVGVPFFVKERENSKMAMQKLMKEIASLSNIAKG